MLSVLCYVCLLCYVMSVCYVIRLVAVIPSACFHSLIFLLQHVSPLVMFHWSQLSFMLFHSFPCCWASCIFHSFHPVSFPISMPSPLLVQYYRSLTFHCIIYLFFTTVPPCSLYVRLSCWVSNLLSFEFHLFSSVPADFLHLFLWVLSIFFTSVFQSFLSVRFLNIL